MTRGHTPLFALDPPPGGDALLTAAKATVDSLRIQGAIQPWHELDCSIVLELAKAVSESRGIAKSQMFGALLAARARLPEPVVAETNDDLVIWEADRDLQWERAHPAELSNPAAT